MEKKPGDQQSDPNDEAEQAHQINGRQPADAFLAGFQLTFYWVAAGLALFLVLSLSRRRIWLKAA